MRTPPTGTPRNGTVVLRRSRRDLLATGVITATALLGVGTVWVTSEHRAADLTTAEQPHVAAAAPATAPAEVHEAWRSPDSAVPGQPQVQSGAGLVFTADGGTLTAVDPMTGDTVWEYRRSNHEICSVGSAFDRVYVTYRTGVGCGDVIGLDTATGEYRAARSAIASGETVPIRSNDAVGLVSRDRVELWRNDLVRTVEYGEVEAKQEPTLQPNEDCTINSALTRKDLLSVVEHCPPSEDREAGYWLRMQERAPKDSRKPVIKTQVFLGEGPARIIASGQEGAVVYRDAVDGEQPRMVGYDLDGGETGTAVVPPAPLIDSAPDLFSPVVADLPHHLTWFDGERLYLFTPESLVLAHHFWDALGTGVAVGERLLYPTSEGIAVANWDTGETERVIPVDRGGYTGQVTLSLVGGVLVEKRGDGGEVVGLVS
ncbi:PQQ-binding-like beta-propeller repeat protein [Corynebacterium sp. P7003]|uniref:PQQ-binding-like beta-propeller repeat protein n=1 Tax=Corynebacterium pygosceleis TaxID=2800406 RepID=A0ABT3WR80_9CORY|nr:PQQ-binding-like beta-propeller repeat protein [Corynebacterium pygosceleis]MCX7444732.1 PQQ-binding-like beta-propeller repeat protein [Corynebacterium pygosceleis]